MAKSLRSKWKRKMKQVKRERYGKKELERLKGILQTAKENDAKIAEDVTMRDESELYRVITRASARRKTRTGHSDELQEGDNEQMDVDSGKIKILDPETMKDQDGNFPVWMSSHRRKKLKRISKKIKMQKKKVEKKKDKKRRNY